MTLPIRLVLPFITGLALIAQAPAAKPAAPAPATPAPGVAAPVANPDDELLVIKATPYKPTLVRDPFSAPTDMEKAQKGDLIDDIAVKGRIITNGKTLAVVSDSRGNVRWLPVGYKFRDGELSAITEKEVVFKQRDVNSTTGAYRTVVRPFKREEGK